jgi:hypothetical protein
VTNARVSLYALSIPTAITSLDRRYEDNLREYGGKFFTELLDLYFGTFGRGNTLNEYLLDNILLREPYRNVRAISLSFSHGLAQPLQWSLDAQHNVATLAVSAELANELIGAGGALGHVFWQEAWKAFHGIVVPTIQGLPKESVQKDWVSAAVRNMSSSSSSLAEKLRIARCRAERLVWNTLTGRNNGVKDSVVTCLDEIYPGEHGPLGRKLERILLMLQGSLCLVPWARANNHPLSVITIPAVSDGYKCGWTVIPDDAVNNPVDWAACHPAVNSLFRLLVQKHYDTARKLLRRGAGSHASLRQEEEDAKNTLSGEWHDMLAELEKGPRRESLIDEFLVPLGKKFLALVRAATQLTGGKHEAHDVNFSFIYGPSELLKHVDRIVSHEDVPRDLPDDDYQSKMADYELFTLRCEGHYALFQQERIAGFVDPLRKGLAIDKVVLLGSPPDEDLLRMRQLHILDDRYRALRWLTWKVFGDDVQQYGVSGGDITKNKRIAALVAAGDGHLRLFVDGRLVLTWKKRSESGKPHWQFGIEAGTERESAIGKLRETISVALEKTVDSQEVREVVATICEISDTPGEGAVFVIGGEPETLPVLCDMVPDTFKMQWASVRQLTGTEQQMLRSLAVMDGAVHIAVVNTRDEMEAWVCARRYIAVVTDIPEGKRAGETTGAPNVGQRPTLGLAAQEISQLFGDWAAHLVDCGGEEEKKAAESLGKWREKIGTKGTRHRSVIQLCLWLLNRRLGGPDPIVCSISADGPVNLFRVKECTCGERYLWTEEIIY